ncbi:hypothetical protein [Phenylobacterium sp.]|uniref:hypothetical protein n=1 Tax=Phenylobacterium sp. TaxID=1871053 RepID=UPI003563CA49
MRTRILLGGSALALALVLSGQAFASGNNNSAPDGPVILDLVGQPVPHTYTQYTASFIAGTTSTDLSFAFREDPAFISLDDIVLTTGGGANLVVNGGFEAGLVNDNAPVGWTYLNVFGASAAGTVQANNPHSGLNNYYDGAVQAYDAITQNITTVVGQTYNLSFWLDDNSQLTTFQHLSTNGNITGSGGNGIDLIVYAGDGVPVPAGTGGIPEPATWAIMLVGFFGAGAAIRGRRKLVAATA